VLIFAGDRRDVSDRHLMCSCVGIEAYGAR
jgi:hypothetical protein